MDYTPEIIMDKIVHLIEEHEVITIPRDRNGNPFIVIYYLTDKDEGKVRGYQIPPTVPAQWLMVTKQQEGLSRKEIDKQNRVREYQ